MKTLIRKWLGIDDDFRSLEFKINDRLMRQIDDRFRAKFLFDPKPYDVILERINQARKESEIALERRLNSEIFLDELIERIKRKQL